MWLLMLSRFGTWYVQVSIHTWSLRHLVGRVIETFVANQTLVCIESQNEKQSELIDQTEPLI